ncbi:ribose-phosphate pyrophosphokinase 1 [Lithohypha guttulata]|nr:ribose-phosphate pyrophosphokinase 1 [Lithohypha guttulata]
MRGVKVFAGRSHPDLAAAICERLGTQPGKCDLGYFANGETRVQLNTSIRNEDVFIVQSGSKNINDSVMELLIMIAACKGGSAKSITAVMPYFPYARSSKKKSHRGAITAKLLANLMAVAGVTHLITVDLHAAQMQGFFHHGIDNLHCEPLLVRWIKGSIPDWQNAVIVSKNVGGSKRVTALADILRLSFALCSTNRSRGAHHTNSNMTDSVVFFDAIEPQGIRVKQAGQYQNGVSNGNTDQHTDSSRLSQRRASANHADTSHTSSPQRSTRPRVVTINSSPLVHTTRQESASPSSSPDRGLLRVDTAPSARRPSEYEAQAGFHDEKARDVVIGRLVQGHIVDDDHPSPALSALSGFGFAERDSLEGPAMDPMTSSFMSTTSSVQEGHALGGTFDAAASSEDEEDEITTLEHTVTLVGNVRGKTAIIMDDIMDKSGSWVAAAETCVKIGGAKKVYCISIHALLGEGALEELDACDCIDHIVVTNTFPIPPDLSGISKKLVVIDLSNLLSEAIRRNHHGESVSSLFMQD